MLVTVPKIRICTSESIVRDSCFMDQDLLSTIVPLFGFKHNTPMSERKQGIIDINTEGPHPDLQQLCSLEKAVYKQHLISASSDSVSVHNI